MFNTSDPEVNRLLALHCIPQNPKRPSIKQKSDFTDIKFYSAGMHIDDNPLDKLEAISSLKGFPIR